MRAARRTVSAGTYGHEIRKPIVLIELEPGTDYHAALVRRSQDAWRESSNVVAFRTADAPQIDLPTTHPRVVVSADALERIRSLAADEDESWMAWAEAIGNSAAAQARAPNPSTFSASRYCPFAALLYLATDDTRHLDSALTLFDIALDEWEGTQFGDNQYRWSSARLGKCLDLLWNDLSREQRDRALSAVLVEDEAQLNESERVDDTDHYANATRTWLIDGLVGCGADGVDEELSERSCVVLDRGLRRWFGLQLVQTRRDRGYLAHSGGYPPDGSFYGATTLSYWFESLWALHNAGVHVRDVSPWVRNTFVSFSLQSRTPSGLGVFTMGDVESYSNDAETNSYQTRLHSDEQLGWQLGLLAAAGDEAASYARFGLQEWVEVYGRSTLSTLLFEGDDTPVVDPATALPTGHLDSGFGLFVDRTSWRPSASMLLFTAGWRGVDHRHADVGHFQLYRNSGWLTHEILGYDGVSGSSGAHNALMLDVRDREGGIKEFGSYFFGTPNTARIEQASSGAAHAFVRADITGAYQSHVERRYDYEQVTRRLLWLKSDELDRPDTLVLFDQVDMADGAPDDLRRAQRFHLDAEPVVEGRLALAAETDGEAIGIVSLLPSDAVLEVSDPNPGAEIGVYPGDYYTYRLDVHGNPSDERSNLLSVVQAGNPSLFGIGSTTGFEGEQLVGAIVGSDAIAFIFDTESLDDISLDLPETVDRVWLLGLTPETSYLPTIEDTDSGRSLAVVHGDGIESDAGGVLAFVIRDGLALGL